MIARIMRLHWARLARRLARIARPDLALPFIPGRQETLSGREVWWIGHEGALFDDLADEPVDTDQDAVQFLIDSVAAAPGQIDVLAIGPLTNIATCLRQDSEFAHNVGRLIVMGGDFASHDRVAEHNFHCDAVAAQEVFASSLPITAVGLDVTTQIALGQPEIDRIESAGPLGVALRAEIEQFWRFHGTAWNNPHDPVAALTILRPELFEKQPRQIGIRGEGEQAGLAVTDQNSTSADVVTSLDRAAVVEEIVARILAAASAPAA